MGIRYALIDKSSGEVVNVIIVDPQGTWQPPEGFELVPSDEAHIGGYFENGKVVYIEATVDKQTIVADGIDTATISVKSPSAINEITFYNINTGDVITTVKVDPVTRTATLQVTATTPGAIHIRAGESPVAGLNEVTINAT